jgi:glycosyltransferase involved in cell wall biosynthesis
MTPGPKPVVALLSWGDRFEDFHDKLGITLDDLRNRLTGTWLFNYVEALQASGVTPVLYFVSARVDEPRRFAHAATGAGIRILPAPRAHQKLQAIRDRMGWRSAAFASVRSYVATPWRGVMREMRRDDCGAVLCQEYEYPRFDGAVTVGRLVGVPVFATYQGAAAPGSRIEVPVRRLTIPRAAGLIAGSHAEVARVVRTYHVPADRMAMIPNAIDVNRWRAMDRAAARARIGIAEDIDVAVWHGRIEIESKGLDVLVEAWRLLATSASAQRPRLLLVVGTGQDVEPFRRMVASVSAESIHWEARWVYEPGDVVRFLSAADVAIRSSRREGFAVSLVEAMACGLPVVATDVSGVAEAVGEGPAGVVVRPDDPRAIADAVERLFADPALRARFGRAARARAEEEFSLVSVGRKLRRFMEERGGFAPLGG